MENQPLRPEQPFQSRACDMAPGPERPSGQQQGNCRSESALGHFLEMASLVSLVVFYVLFFFFFKKRKGRNMANSEG